jgi:hypothetical protein
VGLASPRPATTVLSPGLNGGIASRHAQEGLIHLLVFVLWLLSFNHQITQVLSCARRFHWWSPFSSNQIQCARRGGHFQVISLSTTDHSFCSLGSETTSTIWGGSSKWTLHADCQLVSSTFMRYFRGVIRTPIMIKTSSFIREGL